MIGWAQASYSAHPYPHERDCCSLWQGQAYLIKWSTPDVEKHEEKNWDIVCAFINEAGYIIDKAFVMCDE